MVWRRGAWSALLLALGSALLLNVALIGSLVWTDLYPAMVQKGAWVAVVVVWVGAAVAARARDARLHAAGPDGQDDEFATAIEHYLKGNWFETECVLAGLLRRNPRDAEAGLMLATLYRHAGRIEEAATQLERLERMDESGKWGLEISRERLWLAENRQQPPDDPVESTNGD